MKNTSAQSKPYPSQHAQPRFPHKFQVCGKLSGAALQLLPCTDPLPGVLSKTNCLFFLYSDYSQHRRLLCFPKNMRISPSSPSVSSAVDMWSVPKQIQFYPPRSNVRSRGLRAQSPRLPPPPTQCQIRSPRWFYILF